MTPKKISMMAAIVAAIITIGGALYNVWSTGATQQPLASDDMPTANNIGVGQVGVGQNNGTINTN